jgi:hypothetical protein
MRTLLFFFLLSSSAALSACSCAFAPDLSTYASWHFNESDTSAVVSHAKFIGYRNPEAGAILFDFVVIENLYGGMVADTVTLWGQDGGNCNGPVREMVDGGEYILLHSATQGIFSYFGHTLENFSNPYPIYDFPGCGPAALEVNGEMITGPVAPGINSYTLAELKANIKDVVSGELVSTINGQGPAVSFAVWPNPTAGRLTLDFSQPVIAERLDLLDITGRVVNCQNVAVGQTSRTFDIDATGLPSGVYLVRILLENGRIGSKRIVIR